MKHEKRVSTREGAEGAFAKEAPQKGDFVTRWVFLFVMTGLLLTGCQNRFQLEGTVEGLQDGDTLLLVRDINTGLPTDTMVVSEGAFEYNGKTDSVVLALLYALHNPELSTTLFLDGGTTEIHLSTSPGKTTIGGTASNDALQEANYLAYRYGEHMQQLSQTLCNSETDSLLAMLTSSQLKRLQRDLTEKIIALAERNADNEFGYLIIVNLEDETLTPARRRQLIEKMPRAFRKRAERAGAI